MPMSVGCAGTSTLMLYRVFWHLHAPKVGNSQVEECINRDCKDRHFTYEESISLSPADGRKFSLTGMLRQERWGSLIVW
jgi:hypothetical protein